MNKGRGSDPLHVTPPPSRRTRTAGGFAGVDDDGDTGFNQRWDLMPGGIGGNWIILNDLTSLVAGTTAYPPMLGGVRAFNGPTCPWAP